METALNEKDLSTCRICERDIEFDKLAVHSAKCLMNNELINELQGINEKLLNNYDRTIEIKHEIIKKSVLAKRKSILDEIDATSDDEKPSEIKIPKLDGNYLKKGSNSTELAKEESLVNMRLTKSTIYLSKGDSSNKNSTRNTNDINDKKEQYYLRILKNFLKYLDKIYDQDDIDLDLNMKGEIVDVIEKVTEPTLLEFLQKNLEELEKKIKIKMKLASIQDDSTPTTPSNLKLKLFRSISEKNDTNRAKMLLRNTDHHHHHHHSTITHSKNSKQFQHNNKQNEQKMIVPPNSIEEIESEYISDIMEKFSASKLAAIGLDTSIIINPPLELAPKNLIAKYIPCGRNTINLDETEMDTSIGISIYQDNKNTPQDIHYHKPNLDIHEIENKILTLQKLLSIQSIGSISLTDKSDVFKFVGSWPFSKFHSQAIIVDTASNTKKKKRHHSLSLSKSDDRGSSFSEKSSFKTLIRASLPNIMKLKKWDPINSKLKIDTSQLFNKSFGIIYESPSNKGYFSDTPRGRHFDFELPMDKSKDVTIDDFDFLKMIGKGGYGRVWLVRKKKTGDLYAMKIIELTEMMDGNRLANLKTEKDVFEVLEGDYVVKGVFTFIHEHYLCFVMEYMIGGDLGKILEKFGCLNEDVARHFFAELVLAVDSLHSLGIVHRDLKPENFLLDKHGHIKLADFGLSELGFLKKSPFNIKTPNDEKSCELDSYMRKATIKFFNERCKNKINLPEQNNIEILLLDEPLPRRKVLESISKDRKENRIVGTPDYIAPEVIKCESIKNVTIDWWSMGVVLYEFVVGIPPFNDDTIEKIFDNILNLRIEWPPIGYDEAMISPEIVDLIQKLLDPNPKTRLGINGVEDIKNHPFFAGFDWKKIKEMNPLIVSKDIRDHNYTLHNLSIINPHENSLYLKEKILPKSPSLNLKIDPASFKMRRVDLLHNLNQQEVKKNEALKKEGNSLIVNDS